MHVPILPNCDVEGDECFTEMMANEAAAGSDAARLMQQSGAGHRLPMENVTNVQHAARSQPMQPNQAPAHSDAAGPSFSTPSPRSRPAPQAAGALAIYTPPDELTNIRPFATQLPEHMQNHAMSSRYAVRPPIDITVRPPVVPSMPAAASMPGTVFTMPAGMPAPAGNGQGQFYLHMFHMARQGLIQEGLLPPVRLVLAFKMAVLMILCMPEFPMVQNERMLPAQCLCNMLPHHAVLICSTISLSSC